MPSTARVSRSPWSIVAALTMLTLVAAASGQGTSGTLPGPINSQQLARSADILQLSPAQRLALEAAHDDYRVQFRALRDGEIATFLEQQRSVQGGIPKRDVVEELLEQAELIRAKIATLDDALFDRIQPILSDEQRRWVPRLRLSRERQRLEVQLAGVTLGRRIVDLGGVLHDVDLTPADFAAADAMIVPYERRMTVIMRKQAKAVNGMTLEVMDQLAAAGYSDLSQEALVQDPETLQAVLAQMKEIYGTLRGQITEFSGDRRELNQRTARQVAAAVSPPAARRFRNAYYRGAYPRLAALVTQSDDDWMAKALERDDLTPEQRTALAAIGAEHHRRLDALLTTGIERIDRFWAGFSPFELNQTAAEQLGTDLEELRANAMTLWTEALTAAENQLGVDAVAGLRKAVAASGDDANDANDGGARDDTGDEPAETLAFSTDRFLPDRISRRDVRRYVRQLQLEGDVGGVLDLLHADYLERLAGLEVFGQLRDADAAARGNDDADATPAATEARIARVYTLRRQAIEAMIAADAAFFDDVRSLVGEEHEPLLERVRHSRLRQAYAGNASTRLALGRDNSQEASVDLVSIVLETQPSADELARIDALLTEYETGALSAFRARLDAQLGMQEMADRWMAEIRAASREDIAAVVALQVRYRTVMREPTARVTQTDLAIVELNRQTLESLRADLPSPRAGVIDEAYRKAAFPSIYEDPASVIDHLGRAIALDDLTATQRTQLLDLGGAYRSEYETLSRQMIDQLGPSTVSVVGLAPEAFRVWQERQQQLTKIRFDRNELNGRAITRLGTVLTEDQVRRLGGLPTPLGEDELSFYR